MDDVPLTFEVGKNYSNEQIYTSLSVGNAGGVRVKLSELGAVDRLIVFTSVPTARQLSENPYHDRLEGDVLIYTGAGRSGDQSVSGPNARIVQQATARFPIYGFIQLGSRRDPALGAKRWAFLGLLEYLRCFPEHQIDTKGHRRKVWVFEFRVHSEPTVIAKESDRQVAAELLPLRPDESDLEVINPDISEAPQRVHDLAALESVRRQFLAFDPRQFEHSLRDLLSQCGFERIEVTKYSQDGGIDLNAWPGSRSWPIQQLLVQLQAKRWLHTVGRKEVAELRGSLRPHSAGCIVTTSHFSRAAVNESVDAGKVPIRLIDGYELATIVKTLDLKLE